jgi:hypothetical protein
MNPVDHPHGGVSTNRVSLVTVCVADILYRVTTNISEKPLLSLGTPPKDRKRVSLPQEEQVCCVVLRRRRSKERLAGFHGSIGMVLQWLASLEGTREEPMTSSSDCKYYGILRLFQMLWRRSN